MCIDLFQITSDKELRVQWIMNAFSCVWFSMKHSAQIEASWSVAGRRIGIGSRWNLPLDGAARAAIVDLIIAIVSVWSVSLSDANNDNKDKETIEDWTVNPTELIFTLISLFHYFFWIRREFGLIKEISWRSVITRSSCSNRAKC